MSFTIAIIGRPNVGKSTLFNRLVGQKLALVDDQPGVTRDRREGDGRLGDLEFTLIDTAGLDEGPKGSLTARMQEVLQLTKRVLEAGRESSMARAAVKSSNAFGSCSFSNQSEERFRSTSIAAGARARAASEQRRSRASWERTRCGG